MQDLEPTDNSGAEDATAASWTTRGMNHAMRNLHAQAIDCYDKALELDPVYPKAWLNKGTSLAALRKAGAIECLDKAIALDPTDKEAWYLRAAGLCFFGREEEAVESLESALELDPEYAFAWLIKGGVERKLSRWNEAITSLTKFIACAPPNLVLLVEGAKKDILALKENGNS